MIHNIRQGGVIKQIDCELGSGVKDDNGREIIEGDKVKALPSGGKKPLIYTCIYSDSTFWLFYLKGKYREARALLSSYDQLEVVEG